MTRKLDLSGQKFGRLTALNEADKQPNKTHWVCKCECGNEKIISSTHLQSGHTKSCGCLSRRYKNIVKGDRFGRLTVISKKDDSNSKSSWFCLCECGNETVVADGNLKNNHTKSCGCLLLDVAGKHSITHGKTKTDEYNIWNSMRERCVNPASDCYKDYGERGISLCERWYKFEQFYEDMGKRPSKKHSIDRIDNNKGYSPENCKWATRKEQGRNKRNNFLVTINNVEKCLSEWVELYRHHGIKYNTAHSRITYLGWDPVKALTEPPQRRKH